MEHTHLSEGDSDTSDCVLVRTSLQGWEDSEVDLVFDVVHDLLPFLVDTLHSFTVEQQAGSERRRM